MKRVKKDKHTPSAEEMRVASALHAAVKRKEEREAATVRIYSLYRRRKGYSCPFVAFNDGVALGALKDIAHTVKELHHTDLYCLGTFCCLDGKLTKFPNPVLVLEVKGEK